MDLYAKAKTYTISKWGQPLAYVVVKIHPFTLKLKAKITLNNGQEYELKNQWATEEEFDIEIDNFVKSKLD